MNHFEKESLGLFPTPMYRLPNLSRELGTNIWIKRDDLCGIALGAFVARRSICIHASNTPRATAPIIPLEDNPKSSRY